LRLTLGGALVLCNYSFFVFVFYQRICIIGILKPIPILSLYSPYYAEACNELAVPKFAS